MPSERRLGKNTPSYEGAQYQGFRRAIHPVVSMDRRIADQQRCQIALCATPRSGGRRTDVKASRRFLRAWLSWSDARLRRASSEPEKLGWLCRKSSVTPAGDRAATEWRLPRIVIQTSEMVRVEGVSYTGHGVPRKDTVSWTGQSRPHKQNTQERGSRVYARPLSGTVADTSSPTLSGAERISFEKAVRPPRPSGGGSSPRSGRPTR